MKLLDKIISIIKKLKKKNIENKKPLFIENYTINNINWDLINKISKYDIVYVKMNQETIDEYHIQKEHQKRPFLVTLKNDDSVKGYYMTGNLKQTSFKGSSIKMVVNKDTYSLKKNSLIKCNEEITLPFENIENYISKLTYADIYKLKELRKVATSDLNETYKAKLEMGYIVKVDDKKYIIYQKDNQFSYGYNIKITNEKSINSNGEKNPYIIIFNNKNYELNYKDQKQFNNKTEYDVENIFSTSIVYEIDNNKKLLKKIKNCEKKNKKRPKR